jgi:hypothetical protein
MQSISEQDVHTRITVTIVAALENGHAGLGEAMDG